jgi:Ca2+-dependent lipid-binding protein
MFKLESGVLVVQVISGQLARRGSLEIMLDDGYWPSFTSTRARSSHATWDQVSIHHSRCITDMSRLARVLSGNSSLVEFGCD